LENVHDIEFSFGNKFVGRKGFLVEDLDHNHLFNGSIEDQFTGPEGFFTTVFIDFCLSNLLAQMDNTIWIHLGEGINVVLKFSSLRVNMKFSNALHDD